MDILTLILQIIVLLFSVILHEIAHGAMAGKLGDDTAKLAGRLTLNPLKHLDPFGSFLLPLTLAIFGLPVFGWAKPVPINPYNFRDKKWGDAKTAIAGPLANISLAIFFGLILRFMPMTSVGFLANLSTVFVYIVAINLILAVFNLMPIPPLDGSHIFFALLPSTANNFKILFSRFGIFFLLIFIFFLAPIISPIVGFLFKLITGLNY